MMRSLLYRRDKATLSVVAVVTLVYLAKVILNINEPGNAETLFAFDAHSAFRGAIWRFFSYGFLPIGLFDLIISSVAILFLGTRVQRIWSGTNLWSFVFIVLGCSSLIHGILFAIAGKASIVYGSSFTVYTFLVAWGTLFGHETLLLFGKWRMSVGRLVLLFVGGSLAINLITGTDFPTLAMTALCLVIAWGYLRLRNHFNRSRPADLSDSKRIQRLEL